MIIEVIQKYWVQQVCVLAAAVVTGQYHRQVRKMKKESGDAQAIRLAMIALLRDRFYQGYKLYIHQGFFPIQEREIMQDIYDQYHALGGNGIITHLMEELSGLPTYPSENG